MSRPILPHKRPAWLRNAHLWRGCESAIQHQHDRVALDYNSVMQKNWKSRTDLKRPLLAIAILVIAQLSCIFLGETTTPATLAARTLDPELAPSDSTPTSFPSLPPTVAISETPDALSWPSTATPTITPSPAPDHFSQAYTLTHIPHPWNGHLRNYIKTRRFDALLLG
jgi:hypothetical protein